MMLYILSILVLMPLATEQRIPLCFDGYKEADILILTDIADNARLASPNGRFRDWDRQLTSFVRDVSTTNAPISLSIVYYYLDLFAVVVQSSSPTSILLTGFPPRPPANRASLSEALFELSDRPSLLGSLGTDGVRKRINVPIIYATATTIREQSSIKDVVESLREENMYVHLFPVGQAADDSFIESIRFDIGEQFVHVITDFTTLGQAVTDALLVCIDEATTVRPPVTDGPRLGDPRCASCAGVNGICLTSVPDRCDQYLQCYSLGEVLTGAVMQCPHGTLYDGKGICRHASEVLKNREDHPECSWCRDPNVQTFPYQDSCTAYWECTLERGVRNMEARCCSAGRQYINGQCRVPSTSNACNRQLQHWDSIGCRAYFQCDNETTALNRECCDQGFNQSSRTCGVVPGCRDSSCPDVGNQTCEFKKWGDCEFQNLDELVQSCATGTEFDEGICSCIESSNPDCNVKPTCSENYLNTMQNYESNTQSGYVDELRHVWWTSNYGVVKETLPEVGTAARYDGGSYQSIDYFNNNGFSTMGGVWGRIEYQGDIINGSPVGRRMVLMSNVPCRGSVYEGKGPSMWVYERPSTVFKARRIEVGVRTVGGLDWPLFSPAKVQREYRVEIDIPVDIRQEAVREITWSHRDNLLSVRLTVDGVQVGDIKTIDAEGYISERTCGWKLGKGDDFEPDYFRGLIMKVEFHLHCAVGYPSLDHIGVA